MNQIIESDKQRYFCRKFKFGIILYSCLWLFNTSLLHAQQLNTNPNISTFEINKLNSTKRLTLTTLTFGGNGAYFTKVNDQFTVFTGGRGSATFNNRITIGGGGWGMPKAVEVKSEEPGVYNFVKMGYGGAELGYILYPGEKINLGTNVLFAGGAVFQETVPETKNTDFQMFPVIEPSLYCQVKFSKLFHFEMGATYRYIRGTNLTYITDKQLSSFSCYVGFLVSACTCK